MGARGSQSQVPGTLARSWEDERGSRLPRHDYVLANHTYKGDAVEAGPVDQSPPRGTLPAAKWRRAVPRGATRRRRLGVTVWRRQVESNAARGGCG
jgi:hypothetical protein